jgi:SMI1-KNR4 cell-wall
MRENLINRIRNYLRYETENNKATDVELENAEQELGILFDSDYKEFVKLFGGCYVGYSIYGFKNTQDLEDITIVELTNSFRKEDSVGGEGMYVISMDGSGNPILINSIGEVIIFDHDIGQFEKIADSFEDLIEENLPD